MTEPNSFDSTPEELSGDPSTLSTDDRATLRDRVLPWLCLALVCAAFAPTIAWLWYRWTLGIYYSGHAILMPFVVAYLVHQELRGDTTGTPETSSWGFAFLVPSLILLAMDSAIGTQILSAVALIVALPGFSLLLLGKRRTRRLIFPLLIAPLMLPIPAGFVAPVHLVLRHASAFGATQIVPWLGIPVFAEGTMLKTPGHDILVADACSGFSTFYAAVTTTLILAHWSHSTSRRLLLLIAAPVLAIFCNCLRVTGLVLLIHHRGASILETPIHEISGVITFALVLVLLFLIAGRSAFRERAS